MLASYTPASLGEVSDSLRKSVSQILRRKSMPTTTFDKESIKKSVIGKLPVRSPPG